MSQPSELSERDNISVPKVRQVASGAPWRWVHKAVADMKAAPGPSLFYGGVFAIMGLLLQSFVGVAALELALVTGFLLVAPFLAIGLYDISRTREQGRPLKFSHTLVAWQANAPAIGFYALILMLPPWPFCLLALVGLVDAAFHLRTRKSASHPGKV